MNLNVLRWSPEGKGAAHSLIVLCHGVGADASQMEIFVEQLRPALPGAAFLAPDGPYPFDQFPQGRQWFSLRDRTPAVMEAGAREATPFLLATVDAECARLGVPPGRVAMAGFSQGAMMVLHAGLRRTPPPACILAYSGALLLTPELAGEMTGRPPTLLVHGERDNVVPFALALASERALRQLGVPVETCWRPGLEHSIDDAGVAAGLGMLQRTVMHPG